MAKPKSPEATYMTQREKFIKAARELGADEDVDAFRRIVRTVATAPTKKVKKAAKKRKR